MKVARVTRLLLLLLPLTLAPSAATHVAASTNPSPFCSRLGHSIQASSGAQMYCFGPQPNGPTGQPASAMTAPGANVNAANPAEDVSPAGVRAYGQSETSVAASGPYVVEAWNDSTGFFAPCPSPQNKEEGTGLGFSADGGASFRDLGGLPNNNCNSFRYEGDPSVEAWQSGGATYFYISSLYNPVFPPTAPPPAAVVSYLAVTACKASGTGAAATLSCSQPILVAQSTSCFTPPGSTTSFCSFLDKDFLTLDPARGRLYMSYTDFGQDSTMPQANGQIELAVCDIGKPDGTAGPAGGTAATPVCTQPSKTGKPARPPYFVVAQPNATCENEGAYPALDQATGDVYVAWEFNWASNIFNSACFSQPTQENVARVPNACLTLTGHSPCTGPSATAAEPITSMDAAFIPGYNRFPMNDFPRIAVSDPAGTVSIAWNDARHHPTGDILLQSYTLGGLAPVQSSPVQLNSGSDDRHNAWHFLPGLRYADAAGHLNVSWYDRRLRPATAFTDVFAALNVDPRSTSAPSANVRVTTVSSDWNADSSDIVPNFGDYTDNYVTAVPTPPYHGSTLYVAWSDGRLGEPQPFEAHLSTS